MPFNILAQFQAEMRFQRSTGAGIRLCILPKQAGREYSNGRTRTFRRKFSSTRSKVFMLPAQVNRLDLLVLGSEGSKGPCVRNGLELLETV
ncbi:hypothetical protein A8B77_04940 [Erythrobacter sp. EhN03]|nr:hypothetical protein A8B77_04940 [Erythrobacter sp. EhN03]